MLVLVAHLGQLSAFSKEPSQRFEFLQVAPVLEVQVLEVQPRIIESGGYVNINAVVLNRGTNAVEDLQIGVAVSEVGSANGDWTLIHQDPPVPISTVGAGEKVHFSSTLQMNGDGWFQVGIAAIGANVRLAPRGRNVLIVAPMATGLRAITLFISIALILGIGSFAVWILATSHGQAVFSPDRRTIAIALVIIGSGLGSLGAIHHLALQLEPDVLYWLPYGAVAVIFLGCTLTGAGLRPRGETLRGVVLASVLYVLIGIGWVIFLHIGLAHEGFETLVDPGLLLAALLWPFQVTQLFGIPGLGSSKPYIACLLLS